MPLCFDASGSVRVEQEDVIGEMPGRRPDLLAVDDELVAVEDRAATEVREVGSGVRLGVALTPDVLATQDPGQVVLLLLFTSPLQDRVADHLDAEDVVGRACGHARLRELLGDDHLLERRETRAAVLTRPPEREHAVLVERAPPLEGELGERIALE